MRKITVSLIASATLVLTGCSNPPSQTYESDWLLSSGTDSQGEWVEGSEGAVRLTINDGQVSGQICNSWGGDIDINGPSVAMTSLFSTKMYCTEPAGIMDRETRFLSDLSLVTTIELVDGRLRLSGGGVELEFIGSH